MSAPAQTSRSPWRSFTRFLAPVLAGAVLAAACLWGASGPASGEEAATPSAPWWKGNVHTHTRWSDGQDYPETVADWYKTHGYQFLVLTDHNTLLEGDIARIADTPEEQKRLRAYADRFKASAKIITGKDEEPPWPHLAARLLPMADLRKQFEEPGKFLLIQGEEITGAFEKNQIHLNAWPLAAAVPPAHGKGIAETVSGNLAAAAKQEEKQKAPAVTVLNHPNWGGGVPVEVLAAEKNLKFFEVVNSSPADVENRGDATRLSTDRLWDVALAKRLGSLGLPPLFAIAADDSHDVDSSGTAFIVVRAKDLSAESLVAAMQAGDFYASTGVRLKDIRREGEKIVVDIDAEAGVTYVTQFIGTLPGYDTGKEAAKDASGRPLPPTQRYSPEIGKVLAEVKGASAAYTPTGRELYVRAKILSSKPCAKAKGEVETAWTQPVVIKKTDK
jgi:hypothetical protein